MWRARSRKIETPAVVARHSTHNNQQPTTTVFTYLHFFTNVSETFQCSLIRMCLRKRQRLPHTNHNIHKQLSHNNNNNNNNNNKHLVKCFVKLFTRPIAVTRASIDRIADIIANRYLTTTTTTTTTSSSSEINKTGV
jgi:hypothetical protein